MLFLDEQNNFTVARKWFIRDFEKAESSASTKETFELGQHGNSNDLVHVKFFRLLNAELHEGVVSQGAVVLHVQVCV